MNPEEQAQLARRLASLGRWVAVMNYMLMYPDANRDYAHSGLGNLSAYEAYQHVAERLRIHSHAIQEILNNAT